MSRIVEARRLVHGEDVNDGTARLYDIPVNKSAYDHLVTQTLPTHISEHVRVAGQSFWLKCADPMQVVWLSYGSQGPKAYLSDNPQDQAQRRADIARNLRFSDSGQDANFRHRSFKPDSIPEVLQASAQVRIDAILQMLPQQVEALLRDKAEGIEEWRQRNPGNYNWVTEIGDGYNASLDALLPSDPWASCLFGDKAWDALYETHHTQARLMKLRDQWVDRFVISANDLLADQVDGASISSIPACMGRRHSLKVDFRFR